MQWSDFEPILNTPHYTPEDMAFIRRAFDFSQNAHRGQKRASGEPYFNHSAKTAYYVAELGLDAHTIAAAVLHDTLEDCDTPRATLAKEFGEEVAFLVESVSKLSKVRYRGLQRKVESLRKMFLAVAEDVRVVLIKLMDRLHNMETIRYLPKEKQGRIALETLEIFAPIAYRLGIGELKGKLEDLAFPIVHPDEHAWVQREVETRMLAGKEYLAGEVRPVLEEALRKESITPLGIDSRAKHLYSLWKKLLRNDMDIERITDLLAMRIIVRNIEECYQTLGIIHQLWKPLPGRIKDYIALPKPNGYRSLHTTVFAVGGHVTEFQIRTKEMHDEAEHGIAAHWAYAETGKPKSGGVVDKRMAWVHDLAEWQKEIGSAVEGEEFLESLKIDFFKDRIFVLTPKGEVIDLAEGATPIDFAYHIHSEIGDHMLGAKVNGKMVQFSHELKTGDTVHILTQKKQRPRSDWLSLAKTSVAKSKIRAALHREEERSFRLDPKLAKKHHRCELTITAQDRVGLLKDITAAFSFFRINIDNVFMNTQNKLYPVITVSFAGREEKQLDRLMTRVRGIKNVAEVTLKREK